MQYLMEDMVVLSNDQYASRDVKLRIRNIKDILQQEKNKENNYRDFKIDTMKFILRDEDVLYFTLDFFMQCFEMLQGTHKPDEAECLFEFSRVLLEKYEVGALRRRSIRSPMSIWTIACLKNNTEMIKLMLEYNHTKEQINKLHTLKCKSHPQSSEFPKEMTALMIAVNENNYALTKLLLDNGADITITSSNNFTVLHAYVMSGQTDKRVLELLLKQSKEDLKKIINVKFTSAGLTPLMIAIKRQNISSIKLLLETELVDLTIKTNPSATKDGTCLDVLDFAVAAGVDWGIVRKINAYAVTPRMVNGIESLIDPNKIVNEARAYAAKQGVTIIHIGKPSVFFKVTDPSKSNKTPGDVEAGLAKLKLGAAGGGDTDSSKMPGATP